MDDMTFIGSSEERKDWTGIVWEDFMEDRIKAAT